MVNDLSIAIFSDIHFCHSRNKTIDIIKALKISMDWDEYEIPNLLVFSGDVFDKLVDAPNEDITEVQLWIFQLLEYCSINNIVIRILEGTPSHDWCQSKMFETIATGLKSNVDIKYVNELSIEYIKKFDINILYIPDEWESSTDKTLEQVKELISSKGLSQVDFGIFHGNFEFHLPSYLKKIPRHDSSEYEKLVKHFIFIGHNHKHSKVGKIITPGSFDRLSHGEEEPKGYIKAIINEKSKEAFLIENKLAKEYITINCCDLSLEDTLQKIQKDIIPLKANACVRIEANSDNAIFTNMLELVKLCPTITWTKLPRVEDEEVIEMEEDTSDFDQLIINQNNITQLLIERAATQLNEKQIECALLHLKEIVNGN